eukprot:461529-Alexandrium_andersonii.AAC.1
MTGRPRGNVFGAWAGPSHPESVGSPRPWPPWLCHSHPAQPRWQPSRHGVSCVGLRMGRPE